MTCATSYIYLTVQAASLINCVKLLFCELSEHLRLFQCFLLEIYQTKYFYRYLLILGKIKSKQANDTMMSRYFKILKYVSLS